MILRREVSGSRRATRAFTLLEMLLAVTIAGALLVASISFLLSMSEIWGRGSTKRLFDQHVRGVTRFLESFLQQAKMPEASAQVNETAANQNNTGGNPQNPPGGGAGTPQGGTGRPNAATAAATPGAGNGRNSASSAEAQTKDRFTFGSPSGYDQQATMLMFEVDQAPGLCIWPDRPLPRVECALNVTAEEGLVLLWMSKLEEDYGQERARMTQISPYVQAVGFEYFDEQTSEWVRKPSPIKDGSVVRMPQRIQLTFRYGSEERLVSISIPPAPGGPPLR